MKKILILISLFLFFLNVGYINLGFSEEGKWGGLDEVVIEGIAKAKGREPKAFLELEGDLELFAFSLFFGISGFIAGYYWRKLLSEKRSASQTI